ncbi:MAG: hypothetical protein BGO95_10535 [Micrococcales bacterium 73-13]|nr:MAG: hypothetical protein BGO95_10535 [Micrococcales bacterium 73-13]
MPPIVRSYLHRLGGDRLFRRHPKSANHRRRRIGLMAGIQAIALGAAVVVAPLPASAEEYPSWDEVLAARGNAESAQRAVDQINALLVQLAAEAERTAADLEVKSRRWQVLNQQTMQKQAETQALQEQSQQAEATAIESETMAGRWAAQAVRVGGGDPTLRLFTAPEDADNLLTAIGVSARMSSQANLVYERAIQERNTARSLAGQAAVMERELEQLEAEAETAMQEAQAASEAATKAQVEQEARRTELEAQLAVVRGELEITEAQYKEGERIRREEELAGLGIDWGQVSSSGWAKPVSGFISSYYGPRDGGWHNGLDIAQGCWVPELSAKAGVVTRVGWYGGYGYSVDIDHGGGLWTRYAHMPDGGAVVSPGQWVEAGQQIGYVGTTGNSTGCHLHFEIYTPSGSTDPLSFMTAQGIYF